MASPGAGLGGGSAHVSLSVPVALRSLEPEPREAIKVQSVVAPQHSLLGASRSDVATPPWTAEH